jgi:ribosomal protein S14
MYYNCNFNLLTQFLESPRQIKKCINKNNVNIFNGAFMNTTKNFICQGSCERWQNKKINSKFRTIISDQKKRSKFEKHELKNIVLKTILTTSPASQLHHSQLAINTNGFNKTPKANKQLGSTKQLGLLGPRLLLDCSVRKAFLVKQTCFAKIRNRCILTARNTAINKLGLSRIMLRKLAGFGKLPGITKIIYD